MEIRVTIFSFHRSTNDNIDVLQSEIIKIQVHMNEVSMEKDEQIEKLRSVLRENYQDSQRLDQIETIFDQVNELFRVLIYENFSIESIDLWWNDQ